MKRSLDSIIVGLALAAISNFSFAAFSLGNSVQVTYLYPDIDTIYSDTTVTAPADSLSSFAGILDISFTDTSISMTLTVDAGINNVAFDGLRFIDLNATLPFAGLTIDPGLTTYAQFDQSRISYGLNTVYVNLVNLPGLPGQSIVLTAAPVPEPSTLALTAAGGISVLGLVSRRRRRQ